MACFPRIGFWAALCLFLWAGAAFPAHASDEEGPGYLWPVRAPKVVTSIMGDVRQGHIHSGIDISLFGKVGTVPIVSVGEGELLRIRVSRVGFGKALYIRMNDSNTAVYAHLDRFVPRFEELAVRIQRRTGHYEIDETFLVDGPRVKQGEIIAYGGKTGTSTPHLHFELRDKDNICRSPLNHGFVLPDTMKPGIKAVMFQPLWPGGAVNRSAAPRIFPLLPSPGGQPSTEKVELSGRVGLAVLASDRSQPNGREFFPHRILLAWEGRVLFEYRADMLDYADKRVALIQYERAGKGPAAGAYILLHNPYPCRVPFYPDPGPGFLDVLPNGEHTLSILVYDAAGNRAAAAIRVVVQNPPGYAPSKEPAVEPSSLPHSLAAGQTFATPDKKLTLAAQQDGLFAPMPFSYSPAQIDSPQGLSLAGPCFRVTAEGPPLRKPVAVSMPYPKDDPQPLPLGIYLAESSKWKFLGGEIDAQKTTVTGQTLDMGAFCMARDSAPPQISAIAPLDGAKVKSSRPAVGFEVFDGGAGINNQDIQASVDGKLVVLDAHQGRFKAAPYWNLDPGKHSLNIHAKDRAGNTAEAATTFIVTP